MKERINKIVPVFIGFAGLFCMHSITIKSIFLIITLILFLITIDKGKIDKIKKNPLFIPTLLIFFYLLIHIFISKNKIIALKHLKAWWTIIYLFIIPFYIDKKDKRNLMLLFFLIGVLLGIIWGFYKYFTYYINSTSRLKGFGVGILPFALFMGFGVLIFVYFLTKWKNYLILIPITLSSLVINFTRSIGPFLALFPSLFVFLFGKEKKERFFQIFLCYIILTLSFFSVKKTVDKWSTFAKPEEITNATVRRLYWKYSIYCFKKSPIIGMGTGDFWTHAEMFIKDKKLAKWEIKYIRIDANKDFHAHNLYIDTLGRTGIIGFLLLIYLLTKFLITGIVYWKKDRTFGAILLSAFLYIIFYSLTEDPLFRSDMAFPLYYIFGSNIGYDNNKNG